MKKLNFKIDEKMVKKLSLTEIAVLASISRKRTQENVTEYRYVSNIAKDINISTRTVENALATLRKENAFLKVERVQVEGMDKQRNKYFFTPLNEGFVLVSDEIFSLNLKADEIGFLIKAKSLCYENGLSILGNMKKVAELVGISFSKVKKLIDQLTEKGLIDYVTGKGKAQSKLTLKGNLFLDNSKFGRRNRAVKIRRARSKEMNISMIKAYYQSNTPTGKVLRYMLPKAKYPYAAALAIIKGVNNINEMRVNTNAFMSF